MGSVNYQMLCWPMKRHFDCDCQISFDCDCQIMIFRTSKCVSLEMRGMHDAERRSPRSPTPARAQPPPHPTPHSTRSPMSPLASRLFKARLMSGIGFVCVGICKCCAWECWVPLDVGVGAGGCAFLPVPGCEHCEGVACITSRGMF